MVQEYSPFSYKFKCKVGVCVCCHTGFGLQLKKSQCMRLSICLSISRNKIQAKNLKFNTVRERMRMQNEIIAVNDLNS